MNSIKQILAGLLFFYLISGCSSKKNETNSSIHNSSSKDTFYIENKSYFKSFLNEIGNQVNETKDVKFYFKGKSWNNERSVLIKTISNKFEVPGGYPQYELKIEVYGEQTNHFDKLIWSKEIKGQTPVGIWNNYFQTKEPGCCDSEDGLTLYKLDDGTETVKFSGDLEHFYLSDWSGYIGFQAASATNFNHQDTTNFGILYILPLDKNMNIQKIIRYNIHYKGFLDQMVGHTPNFKIKSSTSLKKSGFFRGFNLFKKGMVLKNLDTAKFYLTIDYGVEWSILTPIDSSSVHVSELISNDRELSSSFLITKALK